MASQQSETFVYLCLQRDCSRNSRYIPKVNLRETLDGIPAKNHSETTKELLERFLQNVQDSKRTLRALPGDAYREIQKGLPEKLQNNHLYKLLKQLVQEFKNFSNALKS